MDLELEIYRQLKQVGVPANLKGYRCLMYAVKMVYEDSDLVDFLVGYVYPAIANTLGMRASSVERNIRHAIEYVFTNTEDQVLEEYFGHTLKANSGKLSNKQFIAGMAEYLRMEVLR